MATASEAISRIAEATGILPATVFRAARYLREHDTALWPQGAQGRGREAHVDPSHLTNVVLALVAADPLTTAPEVVARLRELVPSPTGTPAFGCEGLVSAEGEQFLPGATLGDALNLVIAAVATPEGHEHAPLTVTIYRIEETLMCAVLSMPIDRTDQSKEGVFCYYNQRRYYAAGNLSAPLNRQVSFDTRLIRVLADLYADTLEHRARQRAKLSTKGKAPASAESETKGAGISAKRTRARA